MIETALDLGATVGAMRCPLLSFSVPLWGSLPPYPSRTLRFRPSISRGYSVENLRDGGSTPSLRTSTARSSRKPAPRRLFFRPPGEIHAAVVAAEAQPVQPAVAVSVQTEDLEVGPAVGAGHGDRQPVPELLAEAPDGPQRPRIVVCVVMVLVVGVVVGHAVSR